MPHTDVLADNHDVNADPGASAGNRDAAGPTEKRKADQPRAITRLSRGQPEDGSGNVNVHGDQTQKKLKLCRYFGTPGGEC